MISQMFHGVVHFFGERKLILNSRVVKDTQPGFRQDLLPSVLSCPKKWDYWAIINVQTLSFRTY